MYIFGGWLPVYSSIFTSEEYISIFDTNKGNNKNILFTLRQVDQSKTLQCQ